MQIEDQICVCEICDDLGYIITPDGHKDICICSVIEEDDITDAWDQER